MGCRGEIPARGMGTASPSSPVEKEKQESERSRRRQLRFRNRLKGSLDYRRNSFSLNPNQKRRLRLLSDSCLWALRAWATLGCRPGETRIVAQALLAIPHAPLACIRHWRRRTSASDLPEGFLSPRSMLVGQGSSDSPPGCHSLLPQFDKAEPSDSLLRFALI